MAAQASLRPGGTEYAESFQIRVEESVRYIEQSDSIEEGDLWQE
jgi:hypothetical protein